MNQLVDLLPDEHLAGNMIKQRLTRWLAMAGIMVGMFILIGLGLHWQNQRLDVQLEPLRRNMAVLDEETRRAVPLAVKLSAAVKQQATINRLLTEPAWCALLSDLAAASDDRILITSFKVGNASIATVQNEENTERKKAIEIEGQASTYADFDRFLRKLSRSKNLSRLLIDDARRNQSDADGSWTSFKIHAFAR